MEMILRTARILVSLVCLAWMPAALAGEPADPDTLAQLKAILASPAMGLEVESAETSPVPGIYEVKFRDGPRVYATPDGAFFFLGDLYATGPGGFTNLAEQAREADRLAAIEQVDESDMIIFPAEGETRAHVTVFTDTTCFYCQKLHKEVPELNRRGVEVRYLAYPRSGLGSEGFRQLATAWCADDRQQALTTFKNRESMEENVCPGNPVASQYELGQVVGVRGTPAIITETGKMIPGYQAADQLMVTIGLEEGGS
jgi:thiol:disulfide interchange protein DsbC